MTRLRFLCAAVLASLCIAPPQALAAGEFEPDVYDLPRTDDGWINGNAATSNYGTSAELSVTNYGPKQGLIRYDTSSIAGLSVLNATLSFTVRSIDTSRPHELNLLAVTSPWKEGTVTWATRPTSEAQTAVPSPVVLSGSKSYSVNVTSLVKRWASGQLANNGILLTTLTAAKAQIVTEQYLYVEVGSDLRGAKVLDLSNPNGCVISEPGLYVLDRNWSTYDVRYNQIKCAASPEPYNWIVLRISANNATLDFRGFEINGPTSLMGTMVHITGNHVTLRNGAVLGGDSEEEGSAVLAGAVDGTTLENMLVAYGGAYLQAGVRSRILATRINLGVLAVNDTSVVANSDILGSISVSGDGSEVRNNRFYGDAGSADACISVTGSRNKVLGNSIPCIADGISILGNGNRIASNILDGWQGYAGGVGILVQGTGNQVDSNAVMPGSFGTCIQFNTVGNFFGGNRCSAIVPYAGTAGQTDWGSNITY